MTDNAGGAVSLRPSDQQAGGGLIDDVDVVLLSLRFVEWNYGGKIETPVPALYVKMQDAEGEEHEQYFSAGDAKFLMPSEDGLQILNRPGSNRSGLNDNANASIFIASIVNAGFPEDKITNSIDCFEGLVAHVKRIAQPKRGGLINPGGGKPGREATVLTVESILSLPWEKSKLPTAAPKGAPATKAAAGKPNGQAGKPAAAPAKAATSGAALDPALVEKADGKILELLADERFGDGIPKKSLSTEIFRVLNGDSDRKAIMGFVLKDEYLTRDDAPFNFDSDTGTILAQS